MKRLSILLAPAILLAGCASTPSPADKGLAFARVGETVRVDGPAVTPLAVIEDSRCPKDVRCVWAGRLKISARIDLGSGSEMREITLGQPQPVADGSLELAEATPDRVTDRKLEAGDYRFGFRFMGGI